MRRPITRWYGGKWHAAPWILSYLPPHRAYVEPFGGGASVLVRKPRSRVEVLNDIDGRIHSLYCCLRDQRLAERLRRSLELTPYARRELDQACQPVIGLSGDDMLVETARRLIVRGGLGFSGDHSSARSTGFRDFTRTDARGTLPVEDWQTYPEAIAGFVARMRGVILDSRDACEVMARHDRRDTLHYVDPPYHRASRRTADKGYQHDMVDADHRRLLDCLRELKGMVVLSGYRCDLYDSELSGWHRTDRDFITQGKTTATESLWTSPSAWDALEVAPEPTTLIDLMRPRFYAVGEMFAFAW